MSKKNSSKPTIPDSAIGLEHLKNWFNKIKLSLPNLPFCKSERNEQLRLEIIRRIAGEVLTDDERAEFLGLPRGCRIREGAKIIKLENLQIGEHCWIGENAVLDASGGLSIGSHTSIGLSVFVWSHSSHLTTLNLQNLSGSDLIKRSPTSIGSGCFIAGPAVILAGAEIGDKCLIQPFSIVEGEIPERSIVSSGEIKKGVLSDAMISKMSGRVKS